MDVRMTARHCTITETERDLARKRIERAARFEARASAAEVLFSERDAARRVEIRLTVPGGGQFLAHGEAETFRTAVDRAAERIERQLRRSRGRVRTQRTAPAAEAIQAR